jgi:integrase
MQLVEAYLPAVVDMPRDLRHHQAAAFDKLAAWLDWLDLEGKRPRTIHNYERCVAVLLRLYPGVPFDEFTSEMVNRALRMVPQRSRYISRSVYNQWFIWGERHHHIDRSRSPMFEVPEMTAGPRRPTHLFTEAEVALLTGLPVQDGALFALLFGALLRRGDAINLKWSHINLDRLRLTIYDGKGGKEAIIPITPQTAAAVADLDLMLRFDPDDHLWYRGKLNKSRKTAISTSEFSRWYYRCLEQAGVHYRKPHTTRHTGHWILKHVEKLDLEERQLVLRHESPETTVRQYPVTDIEDVARKRAGIA